MRCILLIPASCPAVQAGLLACNSQLQQVNNAPSWRARSSPLCQWHVGRVPVTCLQVSPHRAVILRDHPRDKVAIIRWLPLLLLLLLLLLLPLIHPLLPSGGGSGHEPAHAGLVGPGAS
jgi:hypothetical protein